MTGGMVQMWYTSSSSICPELEDTVSSAKYNYIRRNVVETENGLFTYEEAKIPKDVWSIYQKLAELDML